MKRRDFVKSSAAASAGVVLAPYIMKGLNYKTVRNETLGFEDQDTIFIIFEQFGGNDGLNTIIPLHQEAEYINLRPEINIPRADARQFGSSDVFFHPACVDDVHREGLLGLLDRGNLAIVQNVGYEDATLSHFTAEQIWLSGINSKDPKDRRLLEGWLGRFFAEKLPNFPIEIPEHPLAVAIDNTIPLLFKSAKGHMGIAMSDPEAFFEIGKITQPVDPLMDGDSNFVKEHNFVHTIARQSKQYSEVLYNAWNLGKDKLQVTYSSNSISDKFKLISQLIAGGLKTRVFFIKQSNYDSHAQQLVNPHEGQHPTLLRDMSKGISEFMDDAIKQGWASKVAGMTTSEFGRRVYDNGSRGSDHGKAGLQFVFGHEDYLNSGMFGQPPDLTDLDAGNLKYEYDFRRIYANVLNSWFGASDYEIRKVFGEGFDPLPVLNRHPTKVENKLAGMTNRELNVYPNPSQGSSILAFELKSPADVTITIYKQNGQSLQNIRSGLMPQGFYKIPIKLEQSGSFIVAVSVNGHRYTTKLNVVR